MASGYDLIAKNTRTGQVDSIYLPTSLDTNSIERLITWGMRLYASGWDREEVSITGVEGRSLTFKVQKNA